jgi:PAS domain S-box-containing protein/putative nucleotidyltransferase with HDIG domain
MKNQPPKTNGLFESKAEKYLTAKHGDLEHIPRGEVKKLVHTLQVRHIQAEFHHRKLLQAHKTAAKVREHCADFYDLVQIGFFTLDRQGIIIQVNPAGAAMLQVEKSHLLNQPFHLWVAPDFQESFSSHLRQVFDNGNRQSREIRLKPQNGTPFYAALDSHLVPARCGQPPACHISLRDITALKQTEERLRRSEKELTLRNRLTQIFLTIPDGDFYEAVLKLVLTEFGSQFGICGHIAENGSVVGPSMRRDSPDEFQVDTKNVLFSSQNLQEAILAHPIQDGQTICSNQPLPPSPPGHPTIDRFLTVPIRFSDKVIGILALANKNLDYDNQDIRCLEMIADTIAPILSARLQKARQANDSQWAEEALRLAAHKWRTTFDAIRDAICLLDPDGRVLQCNQAMLALTGTSFDAILGRPCWKALYGYRRQVDDCPLIRMKQSLHREESIFFADNRWLKETVDPILDEAGTLIGGVHLAMDITTEKKAETALRESEARFRAIFDQAAVGVGLVETASGRFLKVNQKFCNILGLTYDEVLATTFMAVTHPDDLQASLVNMQKLQDSLIQTFSREKRYCHKDGSIVWVNLTVSAMHEIDGRSKYHIAVVEDITQRRQAEIEVRLGLDKLRQALQGIVGALSNTVEIKDPYTSGHQRRVAQLACAIAQELGLPGEQVEGIQVISFLHDIGKIAVPAEILNRPGKITSMEFNLIRAHPEMGYNILKDLEFPWPVAQAVLQHHERLDGSGYPAGLTDGEIIREAKVLAVSDVVEAMASHRPYRPALGIETALEEITRQQGKLFDPDVVTACLRIFEKSFTFQ